MAEPLRIAMISYYLPSTSKIGAGHTTHELAQELTRRGHRVTMFSDCPPVDGAAYNHRHLRMSGSLRTFRFALRMRRQDFSSFDFLLTSGEDYWLWRRRVPVHVRTMHGSCFEEALHIRGARERLRMVLLGLTEILATVVADRTALVSPGTRRWLPWVRTVVPVGVDLTRFRPADESERSEHPSVLFVGTWLWRKRGRLLADAFVRDVLPRYPDAELWMVSRDVPDDHHASIKVLGRLSDEELARRYRQAWVFSLPSSYEGFGIPYAEALASGTPVVATPNVGARFVLDEGRFGVISGPRTLGAAIADLLGDTERRHRLSEAGLVRAQEFAMSRVAERYESLYDEVLREREAKPVL